eukprot:s1_g271.t1
MFRLKLVPANTAFKFIALRQIAYALSALLVVASMALFFTTGLNFGIDFRGGTMIEIGTEGPADIGDLRSRLSSLNLGDVQVQEFGAPDDVLIRVEQQSDAGSIDQNVVDLIRDELGDNVEYRRVEVVGPKVSSELVEAGTLAVVLAVILMLVYIWFRFEWQFSVGAVLALLHDVLLTIGIFSIIQLEFNLSIIAAILTIVGYSMNDTVVVYDRASNAIGVSQLRAQHRRYSWMELSNTDFGAQPPIDAYGDMGFRIDKKRVEGSMYLLPDAGMFPWHVTSIGELTPAHFDEIAEAQESFDLLLLGTGPSLQFPSAEVRAHLTDIPLHFEVMDTGAACRTYNVLLGEQRRVAAALIAVE